MHLESVDKKNYETLADEALKYILEESSFDDDPIFFLNCLTEIVRRESTGGLSVPVSLFKIWLNIPAFRVRWIWALTLPGSNQLLRRNPLLSIHAVWFNLIKNIFGTAFLLGSLVGLFVIVVNSDQPDRLFGAIFLSFTSLIGLGVMMFKPVIPE